MEKAETILDYVLKTVDYGSDQDDPDVTRTIANFSQLLEATGRRKEAARFSINFKFDVFIVYTFKNSLPVQQLAEKLRNRHLRVWLDLWQVLPGEPITKVQIEGLTHSASVLVCLGQSDALLEKNKRIMELLFLALEQKRPIIPVLLPGFTLESGMPSFLSTYHFFDLREGLTEKKVDRLITGLDLRTKRKE